MQILKQDCDLTLREGLAELYRANPEVESVSKAKGKMFTDHDLTHVIFGCDTSLIGEIVLKPWILFGTTINIEEMKTYAADPEVKRLNEEGRELMGGQVLGTLKLVFYYLPQFLDLVDQGAQDAAKIASLCSHRAHAGKQNLRSEKRLQHPHSAIAEQVSRATNTFNQRHARAKHDPATIRVRYEPESRHPNRR